VASTKEFFGNEMGQFCVVHEQGVVTSLSLVDFNPCFDKNVNSSIVEELIRFFRGEVQTFTFQIDPAGTLFQKKVWAILREIPFGKTKTYGEIATIIGKPKAARAIGSACRANPILLAIPCHRVVSSIGIGGFSVGVDLKKQLLQFEQLHKK